MGMEALVEEAERREESWEGVTEEQEVQAWSVRRGCMLATISPAQIRAKQDEHDELASIDKRMTRLSTSTAPTSSTPSLASMHAKGQQQQQHSQQTNDSSEDDSRKDNNCSNNSNNYSNVDDDDDDDDEVFDDSAYVGCACSAAGDRVVALTEHGTLRLFNFTDAGGLNHSATPMPAVSSNIATFAACPSLTYAIVGGRNGLVQFVDLASGQTSHPTRMPHTGTVIAAAFSQNASLAATLSVDGTLVLWRRTALPAKSKDRYVARLSRERPVASLRSSCFSAYAVMDLRTCSHAARSEASHAGSRGTMKQPEEEEEKKKKERFLCMAMSLCGKRIVVGTRTGHVHMVASRQGQVVASHRVHSGAVCSVGANGDGSLLLVAGFDAASSAIARARGATTVAGDGDDGDGGCRGARCEVSKLGLWAVSRAAEGDGAAFAPLSHRIMGQVPAQHRRQQHALKQCHLQGAGMLGSCLDGSGRLHTILFHAAKAWGPRFFVPGVARPTDSCCVRGYGVSDT